MFYKVSSSQKTFRIPHWHNDHHLTSLLQLHVDGRRCSSSAISFNLRRCHEVAFQGSVLCEVITDNQVNFFIHIQQIGANNLSSCHGNGLDLGDFSALLRVCFLAYRTVVTDIF